MFGCAFLLDDKIESIKWFFKSFLDAMSDQAPKFIFTNLDQAMSNTIRNLFLHTSHRLCLWHISKNVVDNLGHLNKNNEFMSMFNKCLQDCESKNEFQMIWDAMINKFECQDHSWLRNLHKLDHKWCTWLNKGTFFCYIFLFI